MNVAVGREFIAGAQASHRHRAKQSDASEAVEVQGGARIYELFLTMSVFTIAPIPAAAEIGSNEVICGRSQWRFSEDSGDGPGSESDERVSSPSAPGFIMCAHATSRNLEKPQVQDEAST